MPGIVIVGLIVVACLVVVVGYAILAGDREGEMVDDDEPTLNTRNDRDADRRTDRL